MSIPVACQCGQRFMAEPRLAGQIVRCPVCGQGIVVPAVGLGTTGQTPLAHGAAPALAPGPTRPYQPAKQPGPNWGLYLGIAGGVLVVLMLCAGAAALIGYDLAKSIFKP